MHYTVYKITNTINNKIYIGAHKTSNLEDGYMGSGKVVKLAQEKYGIDNFVKEILFECISSEEMYTKEKEIITKDFITLNTTYNLKEGGKGGYGIKKGRIVVKDEFGKVFEIDSNNPDFISGKLQHITKNTVTVKDRKGNVSQVPTNSEEYLSGELEHISTDRINVRDRDGNTFAVSVNDRRYLSGELIPASKGMIKVRNINNDKVSYVHITDSRYLNGELVCASKEYSMAITIDGKIIKVSRQDLRLKNGELIRYRKNMKKFSML